MKKKNRSQNVEMGDFIHASLKAAVTGIKKAQEDEDIKTSNAVINPANLNWSKEKNGLYVVHGNADLAPRVELIEFNIAVTHEVSAETNYSGEVGISIHVVKAGIQTLLKRLILRSAINRLKFTIPVLFSQDYHSPPREQD